MQRFWQKWEYDAFKMVRFNHFIIYFILYSWNSLINQWDGYFVKDPENYIICLGTVIKFCVLVFTDGFQNGLLPCWSNQKRRCIIFASIKFLTTVSLEILLIFSAPETLSDSSTILHKKIKPHIYLKILPTISAQTKRFFSWGCILFFSSSSIYEEVSEVIDTFRMFFF